MQKITFLQKAPTRSTTWRVLTFFLALLLGSSAQAVYAAVSLSSQAATVNQGNGNNTYPEANFDGFTLVDQKPGSTTTPAFDINTGTLILNGGTLNTTETSTSVVNGAFVDYTLYDTNFNPITSGSIQLAQVSVSNGVRTFSTSSAALSLIPLISTAGTGYSLSVSFRATYRNGSGPVLTTRDDNSGAGYTANFDVTGTRTPAPTVNPNNIQLAADGAANPTSYYFPNTGTNPQFPGYNFTSSQNAGGVSGAFDINNGQLRLTNTSVTTTEAGTNTVSSVVLYYRVRSTGSGGGAFQPITLTQSGTTSSSGNRTFIIDPSNANNTNPQPNLVAAAAVSTVGTYAIDIYYQASGVNSTSGTPFTITYPPTGYSTATFTVGGTPIALTIWTGAVNDNWFDAGNWTNGIPNRTTNALIRDLGAGNSVPYPNIRSDFRYTTAGGALIYDNTGSGPAETLNFVMGGSSQASRSIARLTVGQLRVFGTFDNSYDSYIQRENTIMEFAGGNQNITGGLFERVDISGGGVKTLQGVMNISSSINFMTPNVYTSAANALVVNPYVTLNNNAGVLSTDITQPTVSVVNLADRASTNNNNGAQLNGENDLSFLYGFVRTTRQGVLVGEARTYGNIGMDITFTGSNNPGNVEVTRNTVESYSPVNNVYGIRRIIGIRPSDQATSNGGLQANLVFHYRNAETKRLNGPDTRTYGTSRIPEQDLTLFVSTNSGNTFTHLGRSTAPDTVNNTVTRLGVTTFATFTLGDINNPLPVKLVAFNAVRSGYSTLLSWATATEENNKGFNVQTSSDGINFTTLTFVASKLVNSVQALSYTYTDVESGKTGTRYYRLEQVDLDGKTSYSPVRAVSFDGSVATSVALVAYPNPFTDTVGLTLEGLTAADNAVANVKIVDMTGRTVRDQKLSLTGASLSLGDLSDLRSGLYLAKVTLPDGSTKTVRIQRQ